jgi:FkbM family methyltransferase
LTQIGAQLLNLGRSAAADLTRHRLLESGLRRLVDRGLLPRAVWARLPIHHQVKVRVDETKSFVYESTANDWLGRMFFWGGFTAWEHETTTVFFELCKNAATVLDIGANTGTFSLLACTANDRSRVLAFEPVPRIYSRLLANIQANGFSRRCETYNIAVSDFTGSASFHVPFSDVPASSSLDPGGFRNVPGELINVPVSSIDAIVPKSMEVSVVKLDVEKFEHRVLNGMRRVLGECRPAIVIECLPDGPCGAVESILREFGYRFYHLRSEGPIAEPGIIPDQSGQFRNFLCRAD